MKLFLILLLLMATASTRGAFAQNPSPKSSDTKVEHPREDRKEELTRKLLERKNELRREDREKAKVQKNHEPKEEQKKK
ncbi:MAG: hypothetical protein WCH46_05010 [bacterium]